MIKNIKGLKYKPCLQTIAGSWSILKQIFWAIFREKALLNWSHWSNPSLDFIAKIRTYALPLKRVLYFNATLLVRQYPLLKSSENNTGLACCFWWWLVRFPSPDIILNIYLIQVQRIASKYFECLLSSSTKPKNIFNITLSEIDIRVL